MRLNIKRPPALLAHIIVGVIMSAIVLISLLTACTQKPVEETRAEQMDRRYIILQEYKAKYGDDLSTWTAEQLDELTKAYGDK